MAKKNIIFLNISIMLVASLAVAYNLFSARKQYDRVAQLTAAVSIFQDLKITTTTFFLDEKIPTSINDIYSETPNGLNKFDIEPGEGLEVTYTIVFGSEYGDDLSGKTMIVNFKGFDHVSCSINLTEQIIHINEYLAEICTADSY